MPVPEAIRKVDRPANTIVEERKTDGPKKYPVRERKCVKYVPGGNPQPINGKVIGYIIDYKFVPLQSKISDDGPQMLSYGGAAFAHSLCGDLMQDLLAVYPPNDAYSIMSIALMRVLRPHISSSRIASAYRGSFVSVYYPGAAISKNSISSLFQKLGEDGKKREAFFELRMNAVSSEHHIAIDGMLKQNTSRVNDLSAFSYKARLKGCEDISILFAYDIEKKEPICSQVFPGNSIDAVSYRSFIRDNKITKGILVNDKGFPPNNIRNELANNKDLHYLTPVKRNDARISRKTLLDFSGVIGNGDRTIQYSKAKVSDRIYLYAFRDPVKAAAEERTYLERAQKKKDYNPEAYSKKKQQFGLIVYESDLDMEAETAYACYAERWKLELVFKAYKNDDCLDRTSVHGDFSVHGSEFVNFISTVITCRIINAGLAAGLFEQMTYGELLDDLNSIWRKTSAPLDELPKQEDDYWVHALPKDLETMIRLNLCEAAEKPAPGKRGRPAGSKNKNSKVSEESVKRPVGRPRKNPAPDSDAPKRPVGRPRKNPLPDPEAPKRPVGRPRVHPIPDPDQPKRPVGRPRKQPVEQMKTDGTDK